jgi:hypothetical protein
MTGYMISPGVTMQLAYDEAVILPDIRSWLRRFPPAACFRSSARQYTAVR